MVNDDRDESFVRVDRIRIRQRDRSRVDFHAGPLSFAGRVRISSRHHRAVGHGTIGATRGR